MRHTITGDELTAIDLAPETEDREITQNLLIIINSIEGTIPLDRGLGLSSQYIHSSIAAAQSLIAADIVGKIQDYEPRAQLINIDFEQDHETGKLTPMLEVEF